MGQPLKIRKAHVAVSGVAPGKHVIIDGLPAAGTSDGAIVFDELQPAGKKTMPGTAFLTGARAWLQ